MAADKPFIPEIGTYRFFVIEYPRATTAPVTCKEGPFEDYMVAARKRKECAQLHPMIRYEVIETDDLTTQLVNINLAREQGA